MQVSWVSMDSQSLRHKILAKRDGLTLEDQSRCSRLIIKKAVELEQFAAARIIFIYVNFRSEVRTRTFIDSMLALGKKLLFPLPRSQQRHYFLCL